MEVKVKIFLLAMAAGSAWGQAPDIEEIMRRVALNQAKSLELRTNYVYHQKQLLRMGPTNARRIQASLRRIALALGIPAGRLPPP